MTKQLIGIVLATVAIFMWGFVYWGLMSAPYAPLKATNGDEAAGQALLEHFPSMGMYLMPGAYNDPETTARMFAEGHGTLLFIIVECICLFCCGSQFCRFFWARAERFPDVTRHHEPRLGFFSVVLHRFL